MINAYCPRCRLPLSTHLPGCPAPGVQRIPLQQLTAIARHHADRASIAHLQRWGIGSEQRVEFDIPSARLTWWFEDAHRLQAPGQLIGLYRTVEGSFHWASSLGFTCDATAVCEGFTRLVDRRQWAELQRMPLHCDHRAAQALTAIAMVLCRANGVQEVPVSPGVSWYTVYSLRGLG